MYNIFLIKKINMKYWMKEMHKAYNNYDIKLLDRNTLISDWEEFDLTDILLNWFKWKVWELISDKDIVGEYSMLKNKWYEIDNIYSSLKNNLLRKELYRINFNSWDLSEYDIEMWKYLEDNSYILPNMITESYKEFFDNSLNSIFDKIERRNLLIDEWKDELRKYYDLDHDLFIQEKMVLAYYMARGTLSEDNKKIVKEQLSKWWDTEEDFINNFKDSYDFFEQSLNNTFNFIK